MSELMLERCKRICNGHAGGKCLINHESQVSCVSDMVINNVLGIASVIEMAKCETDPSIASEYLDEAMGISNELVNWVRYLQLTRDISKVAAMVAAPPQSQNKRREPRYDMPEAFGKYMSMRIVAPGPGVPATIKNFSTSGLQFRYSGPEINADVLDCVLTTNHIAIHKQVSYKCEPRYVSAEADGFLVGANVVEVSDSREFNFFKNVFDFIQYASSSAVHP